MASTNPAEIRRLLAGVRDKLLSEAGREIKAEAEFHAAKHAWQNMVVLKRVLAADPAPCTASSRSVAPSEGGCSGGMMFPEFEGMEMWYVMEKVLDGELTAGFTASPAVMAACSCNRRLGSGRTWCERLDLDVWNFEQHELVDAVAELWWRFEKMACGVFHLRCVERFFPDLYRSATASVLLLLM